MNKLNWKALLWDQPVHIHRNVSIQKSSPITNSNICTIADLLVMKTGCSTRKYVLTPV
jgi:hypothetical protein